MILFAIVFFTLFLLMVFTVISIAVGGAAFIIVFADVIVCVAIMVWIVKRLIGRKKKK